MLNSTSIGNKIAAARKKVNLSQAELAQHVAISPQAVGKWERGESMPDILTFNRLAEILGVDLNYFSESYESISPEMVDKENTEMVNSDSQRLQWDMSKLNLVDSDFSGLNNLHEQLRSSNMLRCSFIGSNLSGLLLSSNNVDGCDFTDSDISNSQFRNSNIGANQFKNCSLAGTEFSKSNIDACDFTNADFTKSVFKLSNFSKNTVENAKWIATSFSDMQIHDITFDGELENCSFENCSFYGVKFQQVTLTNTFFKNNKKFKRVQFIDCKVDKITYAFLKSNQANLTGITVLE